MGERPTPLSIGVCALVAMRSDPSSPLHEIEFNPHEQDKMTMFMEQAVFGSISSFPRWMESVRNVLGFEVAELLLETLYMASESVDSLVDLIDSICAAVVEGLVDALSVHGVYLRQICLGFEQLSFESLTLFWQEFCIQLDGVPAVEDKKAVQSMGGFTSEICSSTWPLSNSQADEMLQQACRQLDGSYFTFERVEMQVRSMLQRSPEASTSYFLRFLNCLHHKDRTALGALHQFFDHSMIRQRTCSKEILQFSAILLAVVYETFGDTTLALMATEEAVRVAQQSKDKSCVAFALGRLYNSKSASLGRRELLKRCVARAAQGQILSLLIGSSLELSLEYLEEEKRDASLIWRHHMEATAEASSTIRSWDQPTCLSSSPRRTYRGLSRQSFVETGIWDALGSPAQSVLASIVFLNCHLESTEEQRSLALANLIGFSQRGISTALTSSMLAPDETNHGATEFQHAPQIYGMGNVSAQKLYGHVSIFRSHRQCLDEQGLAVSKLIENMVHSSRLQATCGVDRLVLEIGIQTCARLCQSEEWSKARFWALSSLQSPSTGVLNRGKMLLLLAAMENETSVCSFNVSVQFLLEAITIFEEIKMHELHTTALLVLARILLRMRKAKRALSILSSVIPQSIRWAHKSHLAEAYLTQAKCHIQLADKPSSCPGLTRKEGRYKTALRGLEASKDLFTQHWKISSLLEVLYLKARLLFLLGHDKECEDTSKHFFLLQERCNDTNL